MWLSWVSHRYLTWYVLKNSRVWGRREAQRTVSKTRASEVAWKSFSEAAKIIQSKSLRIKKKVKTLGKNISSVTVKYHFLLQTQPVLLFLQRFLYVFSLNIPCTKIQLSVSVLRKKWITVTTIWHLAWFLGSCFLLHKNENLPQNWNSIFKTWIIYWVGPVLDHGKSVRRKEGQRQSVTNWP